MAGTVVPAQLEGQAGSAASGPSSAPAAVSNNTADVDAGSDKHMTADAAGGHAGEAAAGNTSVQPDASAPEGSADDDDDYEHDDD